MLKRRALLIGALAGGLTPSLDLNFLSGTLDSRITASGGANGYVVNSAGVLVPATTPRFDYDPITLACKGLLVEEQRTNLALWSNDTTQSSYTKINGSAAVAGTTAPDGTTTGNSFVENTAAAAFHAITQQYTKAASALTYTYSLYLKDKGREVQIKVADSTTNNGALMRVNPATGAITQNPVTFGTGWTNASGSITPVGNGWYRCTVTVTSDTGTTVATQANLFSTAAGSAVYTGDGVSGMYDWGHQLEAGSFATSYIPTTSAQVTRTADSLVMTGTNFSSWYGDGSKGTLYAEADSANFGTGGSSRVVTSLSGVPGNRITTYFRSAVAGILVDTLVGAVTQSSAASQTGLATNTVHKIATAFAAGDSAVVVDGGTPGTGAPAATPVVSQLEIGSLSGGAFLCGHVRRIRFYPPRLPNAQDQAVTA